MATIGKVSAVFTASTSGLRTGVNQASRSMQQMQQSVAGLRGQLSTLTAISGAQLFGQIASAASQAVRSMVAFGQSQAQLIDDTSKLAARLGFTYGELAGLSLAGDLAGVSMETIGAAVTKADVAFVRAAEGSKTAADAFASIGLSLDNLQGLSAADRFEAIAAAIARLPTAAQRAEAAVQLFGRSGAQLLPLFQGAGASIEDAAARARELGVALDGVSVSGAGSLFDQIAASARNPVEIPVTMNAQQALDQIGLAFDSISGLSAEESFAAIGRAIAQLPTEAQRAEAAVRIFGSAGAELAPLFASSISPIAAARAEAERFGLTLTNMQGRNVENMNDAFTRAQQAVAGVVQQVVAYLAPAIDSVATAFSDLVGNVGGATIGQTIGDGILQGARFLAEIADVVVQNMSSVFSYLSEVGSQWSAVWDIAGRVGALFSGVGRTLAGSFQVLVGVFSSIGAVMLEAARDAAGALGFDTTGLDAAVAGLRGFNDQLNSDIESNFNAAAENFSAVFAASGEQAGEAVAGPITQTLDAAIARAQEAAAAVDVAEKQTLEVVSTQRIDARELREAVQGTDSRSAEGVREMFRIMRGQSGAVDEQQLSELQAIRRAIENQEPDEFDVADLAPAAGA